MSNSLALHDADRALKEAMLQLNEAIESNTETKELENSVSEAKSRKMSVIRKYLLENTDLVLYWSNFSEKFTSLIEFLVTIKVSVIEEFVSKLHCIGCNSTFLECFMKYLSEFDCFSDFMKTWDFIHCIIFSQSLSMEEINTYLVTDFLKIWSFVKEIPSDVLQTVKFDRFYLSKSDIYELIDRSSDYISIKQREIDRLSHLFGDIFSKDIPQSFFKWIMNRQISSINTVEDICVDSDRKYKSSKWTMIYFKYEKPISLKRNTERFAILLVDRKKSLYFVIDYYKELNNVYILNYIHLFSNLEFLTDYTSIDIYDSERNNILGDSCEIEYDIDDVIFFMKDIAEIIIK